MSFQRGRTRASVYHPLRASYWLLKLPNPWNGESEASYSRNVSESSWLVLVVDCTGMLDRTFAATCEGLLNKSSCASQPLLRSAVGVCTFFFERDSACLDFFFLPDSPAGMGKFRRRNFFLLGERSSEGHETAPFFSAG